MFKRSRTFILLLVLTLCVALMLGSCGGTGNGGDEPGGNEGGGNTEGLKLVENGEAMFQFVLSSEISTTAKTMANSTIKSINKVLTEDAETVQESGNNEQEIEIIIGTPSYRGDKYGIDYHYLGSEGYAVKVIDTKVLVLFGSDTTVSKALDHLKENVFGITAKTKKVSEVVVTEDKLIEAKQNFTLQSATVCGNDLNDYVFEYPTSAREVMQNVQANLYNKAGIWIPKGEASANQKAVIIREIDNGGVGTTAKGFRVYVDENANLIVETEFINKIAEGVTQFFADTILAAGTTEIDFAANYNYSDFDARNIYYEDFGAKGNGTTDDFEAIKECHAYANEYGHTVNGKPGSTYYIGKNDAGTSAIIKTDVNWNGCKFIIDDTDIRQPLTASQNNGSAQTADPGFGAAIFVVQPEKAKITYTYQAKNLPITSLEQNAMNVGFEPGEKVLLILYNDNVKHFIRYGENADEGKSQHEIILVDENGNIDTSTPVQWNYENVTKIEVYHVDDKPITISGGEYDVAAKIDNRAYMGQKFNTGRSFYTYYMRNIVIERSNVVLKNVIHDLIDVPDAAAPYFGFTTVRYCNNVTVSGFVFECPPQYKKEDNANIGMGSYEITANEANKVTYKDCTQSNFFEEDGSVIFHGLMGTNFCKNLAFDNMFVCSFDAHCGVYNVSIKNSTVEHMNFIGAGEAYIENVVLYGGGLNAVMNLRDDYGSTWDGNLTVNGLEIRYAREPENNKLFTIVRAAWYNHNFGYTVHFPKNIVLNDISIVKYTFGLDKDGNRWEVLDETTRNQKQIQLIYSDIFDVGGYNTDISAGKVHEMTNLNPVVPIESIVVNNVKYADNPVDIKMPTSPTFNKTKITVDGKAIK